MIATQTYINSLKVRKIKQKGKRGVTRMLYYVGFHENDMAVDLKGNLTNTTLHTVAAAQEFGIIGKSLMWKLPPRKHWTPYYDHMRSYVAPTVRKNIQSLIIARWKQLGIA